MKKILTLFVTSIALVSAAFASGNKAQGAGFMDGKWSIRVFYGFNGGDVKDDLDIDGIFGGALEYTLPNMGAGMPTGGQFHLGLEYNTSTEGIGDVKMDNYGVYGGVTFPIGQNQLTGLDVLLNAGYYNTKLHEGGFSEDKWGFGFDAGFRYKFGKVSAELFYRMRPEVDNVNNNAIVIGVNFPLGN